MKYLSQEIENLKDHEVKTKQEEFATRLKLGISILLAAIIRDFWVVEERHSIFGSGLRTRKFPRIKSDQREPKIFYLPRLRYIRDIKGKANDLNYQSRRPHFVSGHLRKALHASDKQIFLARKYGIIVPEGFTFVRPHKRGDQAQERIYRSRSALKCLQALKNGYSEGSGDLWFKYELNVKNWLNSNGYIVDHLGASKSGDGGVDIQASKEDEHLLVQCKYWQSQKIGPNIIREMIGTLNTFPEGSRGVIVTPSELTAGAKQLAIENGIQYIELADFGTRITRKL
jgi:hypothetical protein